MKISSFLIVGVLAAVSTASLIADNAKKSADVPVIKLEAITDVTAAEAKELLAAKEAPIVIDIRTEEEFREGHIEGARRIDFNGEGFRAELGKLDPKKSYLFHCRSGARSKRSLPIWRELGFTKIFHLDGGILGWEKAKGKVVQGE